MPKFYDSIPESLSEWAMDQAVFYVGSAPTYGRHVNLSPKGLPASSFAILSPNQCAYIDATGSGCETISHVQENGRATVMFCSFGPSPRIMRFFCRGRIVEWDEEKERKAWLKKMEVSDPPNGARAIIILDVFKCQTSCGFGVPLLGLAPDPKDRDKYAPVMKDRETMGHWAGHQIEKGTLEAYQAEWNTSSLDGLPGLRTRRRMNENNLLWGDVKANARETIRGLWYSPATTILVAMLSSLFTMLVLYLAGFIELEDQKRNGAIYFKD